MTATQTAPSASREPKIKLIALDDLRVDPGYQRDPADPGFKSLKKHIVEEYDPALLHILDVAQWDNFGEGADSYFVYDGYCRLESVRALRALGQFGDKIRCAVIQVDPDEQADLFLGQTSRRGVQWPDKHHALLYKKDPAALAIQHVVDDLGLTVGKHGDVRAVQACYSTVEIDRTTANPDAALRPDLLREVLEVAGNAWADTTLASGLRVQYASSDRMIDALALLLSKFGADEMSRSALIDALQRVWPPYIVQKAAAKTSAHGSNNKGALALEILRLFNRHTGQKLRSSRIVSTNRARRRGRATPHRRPKK